jgi:Ni,Fe-hydrogenase III large subunit
MRNALKVVSDRTLPQTQDDERPRGPSAHLVAALDGLPELPADRFVRTLGRESLAGVRVLTYFGGADERGDIVLTAALQRPHGLVAMRGRLRPGDVLPRLGEKLPRLAALDGELAARCDLRFGPAPDLRPRSDDPDPDATYFWPKDQPLEVRTFRCDRAVDLGALHLECDGELVRDASLRPAFPCRAADALLLTRPRRHLPALVETLGGDGSVAHAAAHAAAIEGLAGVAPDLTTAVHRGIALELERIALHLAALVGVARAIGYLPAVDGFARLHDMLLDLAQRRCGSRLLRGWVRAAPALDDAALADLRATLTALTATLSTCAARTLAARSVRERLDGVGGLAQVDATDLGLVGFPARASGVDRDLRRELPGELYRRHPVGALLEPYGDCLTRLSLRTREIEASARWILGALTLEGPLRPPAVDPGPLSASHLAIAAVEGARGPVVHAIETDRAGSVARYVVQDAGPLQWPGITRALRDHHVGDVPLCLAGFALAADRPGLS